MIPTFRKRYVVLTTVAILLFILFRTHEFDDHSTKKKESVLEHELKSLIPYSPNWAQKQFQRWFETLQNYKFTVTLKPSKSNPSDGPYRLVQHNDPNISCLPEKAEVSVNEVTNIEN